MDEIGFCFQAEDGIRDLVRSRGLGDVYKRQYQIRKSGYRRSERQYQSREIHLCDEIGVSHKAIALSLIHI